jgi:hypothetical protein
MKSLKQILREASGGKEAYQKFFNSLLKKFGVSSPSELEGDAKKKFYNAIDKGWDGDNEEPEKNEARRPKMVQGDKDEYYKRVDKVNQKYGIGPGHEKGLGDLSRAQQQKYFDDVDKALGHTTERHNDPEGLDPETTVDSDEDMADKAASTVTEALRAARGKLGPRDAIDIDYMGDKKDIKFDSTKWKITMKGSGDGQLLISGDKQKIFAYLRSDDYGMEDEDIEELFPELFEAFSLRNISLKSASKRDRANKIAEVAEDTNYPKALSVIREWSGDAETQRKKKRRFEDEVDTAHKMNDAMVQCEQCGKTHEEGACGMSEKKWGPVKKGKSIKGAKLGKSHPVMDQGQRAKILKIAKANSGNMAKAIKLIDRIRKGLSDNPAVMDILKKANEDVQEAKIKPPKLGDKEEYYRRVDKVEKQFKIGYGKGKRSISDLKPAELKKYFAARDKALGHDIFDSVNEMTTEVEFDWDSYGFNKRKHVQLMKKHKVKVSPMSMKGPGGVDVDHFAKVVGKKENIRAWMKDWKYDYDAQDYKDMGLALRGESVDEANRFSKKLNKPAKHIFDLALNAIRRNNVRGKKDQDEYIDDVAGVSLTPKEVELVKQAIQHESVNEAVAVDRRTKGFKEAMMRKEKAKIKREKAKIKKEKKKEKEVLDARYDYDGGVDTILSAANAVLFGKKLPEDSAVNNAGDGKVDMAPNAGKKKKKETIVRRGY